MSLSMFLWQDIVLPTGPIWSQGNRCFVSSHEVKCLSQNRLGFCWADLLLGTNWASGGRYLLCQLQLKCPSTSRVCWDLVKHLCLSLFYFLSQRLCLLGMLNPTTSKEILQGSWMGLFVMIKVVLAETHCSLNADKSIQQGCVPQLFKEC